jgi:hypothetical protein
VIDQDCVADGTLRILSLDLRVFDLDTEVVLNQHRVVRCTSIEVCAPAHRCLLFALGYDLVAFSSLFKVSHNFWCSRSLLGLRCAALHECQPISEKRSKSTYIVAPLYQVALLDG